MRWLKSLVIVLGILIVLGVVLLGFGFYKKTTDPDWRLFATAKPETPGAASSPQMPPNRQNTRNPLKPFGNLSLDLAPGCIITKITPTQRLVYLEIGPTADCNRVVIVDLDTGAVLGAISPNP